MKNNIEKIKKPVLIPLALILLVLLGVNLSAMFWFDNVRVNNEVRHDLDGVQQLFKDALATETDFLNNLLSFYEKDESDVSCTTR